MKELVGHYEAAEILGWKKQQVTVYMQRGKFPEPLQKLASGPIWFKKDIQKFKESRMKMRYFKNADTGVVVTEKELGAMHLREWAEMWEDQTNGADEFGTKEEFIAHMEKWDDDVVFVEITHKIEAEKAIEEITKGEQFVNDEQLEKLDNITHVYLENCGISGTGKGTLYTLYLMDKSGNITTVELAEVVN